MAIDYTVTMGQHDVCRRRLAKARTERSLKNYAPDQIVCCNEVSRTEHAYPVDTSHTLQELFSHYGNDHLPIERSFRELVHWIKVGERATHYLHTYPGKLLPQIAHFFLAAKAWIPPNGLVLDPFSGTGTVVLEAVLSGRSACYADVNPLAREITAAKVTPIETSKIRSAIKSLSDRLIEVSSAPVPNVVNIDKWYRPEVRDELARLVYCIDQDPDPVARLAFRIAFSATARKASRANARFSVPVVDKSSTGSYDVAAGFLSQIEANISRYEALLGALPKRAIVSCAGDDARSLRSLTRSHCEESQKPLPNASVDAVITSPPYLSAQKYVRASSLSLGWLGYAKKSNLKEFEDKLIGREHFRVAATLKIRETPLDSANNLILNVAKINRLRATICASYINEMDEAIAEMYRVLKPSGKLVIVVGDNTVCGFNFETTRFISELCIRAGFVKTLCLVDSIKSRALTMNRKGGHSPIKNESIMVFEK